jgi:hypothetical protein
VQGGGGGGQKNYTSRKNQETTKRKSKEEDLNREAKQKWMGGHTKALCNEGSGREGESSADENQEVQGEAVQR